MKVGELTELQLVIMGRLGVESDRWYTWQQVKGLVPIVREDEEEVYLLAIQELVRGGYMQCLSLGKWSRYTVVGPRLDELKELGLLGM